MTTTNELKCSLMDEFFNAVGVKTMNHQEYCVFINKFFSNWVEEMGNIYSEDEMVASRDEAWGIGFDVGTEAESDRRNSREV